MKYICLAYNPLTLAKAISYADNCWGRQNTYIVFVSSIMELPDAIKERYQCTSVSWNKVLGNKFWIRTLSSVVVDKININRLFKEIVKTVRLTDEIFSFVVFMDNRIREASCIEMVKRKFKNRAKIVLLEEGTGIYNTEINSVHFTSVKRVLYFLQNISSYPLKGLPQGLHPEIDMVICKTPRAFEQKLQVFGQKKVVQKQIEVFSKEECNNLLALFQVDSNQLEEIKFVFLTPPDEIIKKVGKDNYCFFLQELFERTSIYGKLLIKPHPRDSFDYAMMLSEKVVLNNNLKKIAFELIYELINKPVLLSLFSSALSCDGEKTSFFLYPMIRGLSCQLPEEFFLSNRIVVCDTFSTLTDELKKMEL